MAARLTLTPGATQTMLRTLVKNIGNCTEYAITSVDAQGETVVHSEGKLTFSDAGTKPADGASIAVQALREGCVRRLTGGHYYEKFSRIGLEYGPAFQVIQEAYVHPNYCLTRLALPEQLMADHRQYILHPCIIDGALQSIAGLEQGADSPAHLPFAVDDIEILKPIPPSCYAYVQTAAPGDQAHRVPRKFNIQILRESGETVATMTNVYVRALRGAAYSGANSSKSK